MISLTIVLSLLAGPAGAQAAAPDVGPAAPIEAPLTDYYLISRPRGPAPPPAPEPGVDDASLRSPRLLSVWVSEPAEEGPAWSVLKWSYRDRTRAAAAAYLSRLCLRGGWSRAEVVDMSCEQRQTGIASLKWECDVYSQCAGPVREQGHRVSLDGETWESKSEFEARVRARYERICKRQGKARLIVHKQACNRQETLSGSHRWSCDFYLSCSD